MSTHQKPRRMARPPQVTDDVEQLTAVADAGEPQPEVPVVKRASKSDMVLDLLRMEGGASMAAIVDATGWLPHTARAALSGLRRKGHLIVRDSNDGITCYAIAPVLAG
ncbi:MAG: DUF3489 domain-containing protein [Pseudomonadota bacterium]